MNYKQTWWIPVVCALAMLAGCAFGGARVENKTVFVEPGGVVRIATDRKLPIVAKDDKGQDVYEERSVGGMVVVPVSTYRELREEWVKTHPDGK